MSTLIKKTGLQKPMVGHVAHRRSWLAVGLLLSLSLWAHGYISGVQDYAQAPLAMASSCTDNYPTGLSFSGGSGAHWNSSVHAVVSTGQLNQYDCTDPFGEGATITDGGAIGLEIDTVGSNIVYFNAEFLFANNAFDSTPSNPTSTYDVSCYATPITSGNNSNIRTFDVTTAGFASGYFGGSASSSLTGLSQLTNYRLRCDFDDGVFVATNSIDFTTTGSYTAEYYVEVEDQLGNPISGADLNFYNTTAGIDVYSSTNSSGNRSQTLNLSSPTRINVRVTESGLTCTPSLDNYDFSPSDTFGTATFVCQSGGGSQTATVNVQVNADKNGYSSAPDLSGATTATITGELDVTQSGLLASNSTTTSVNVTGGGSFDKGPGQPLWTCSEPQNEGSIAPGGSRTITIDCEYNPTTTPSGTLEAACSVGAYQSSSPVNCPAGSGSSRNIAFRGVSISDCSSTRYIRRGTSVSSTPIVGQSSSGNPSGTNAINNGSSQIYSLWCGNDFLDDITVNVASAPSCTGYDVTVNASPTSMNTGGSTNLTVDVGNFDWGGSSGAADCTWTIPSGCTYTSGGIFQAGGSNYTCSTSGLKEFNMDCSTASPSCSASDSAFVNVTTPSSPCPATTINWSSCSAYTPSQNNSYSGTLTDSTPNYTGSANISCGSGGNWSVTPISCSYNPPASNCTGHDTTPTWSASGNSCNGTLPATINHNTTSTATDSTGPYTGSADYSCNDGVLTRSNESCSDTGAPFADITAAPATIQQGSGDPVSVSWYATGSCPAGFRGYKDSTNIGNGTSGVQIDNAVQGMPVGSIVTYSIYCGTNTTGSLLDSETVEVVGVPTANGIIQVQDDGGVWRSGATSLPYDQGNNKSINLRGDSINNCSETRFIADDNGNQAQSASGNPSVTLYQPNGTTETYYLLCGTDVINSINVSVGPTPSGNIGVTPSSIEQNDTTKPSVTWSSNNCPSTVRVYRGATNILSGASGTQNDTGFSSSTVGTVTYTVYCGDDTSGYLLGTDTVEVVAPATPSGSISVAPQQIEQNDSTDPTITWSSSSCSQTTRVYRGANNIFSGTSGSQLDSGFDSTGSIGTITTYSLYCGDDVTGDLLGTATVEIVAPGVETPTGQILIVNEGGSTASSSSATSPGSLYINPNTDNTLEWTINACSGSPGIYYGSAGSPITGTAAMSGSGVDHTYTGGFVSYYLRCDSTILAEVEVYQNQAPFDLVFTNVAGNGTTTVRGVTGEADEIIGVQVVPEDNFNGTVTLSVSINEPAGSATTITPFVSNNTVICETDENDQNSVCGAPGNSPDQQYSFFLDSRVPRDSYNINIIGECSSGDDCTGPTAGTTSGITAELRVLNMVEGAVTEF